MGSYGVFRGLSGGLQGSYGGLQGSYGGLQGSYGGLHPLIKIEFRNCLNRQVQLQD